MAGTLVEDNTGDGRSSSTEEMPSDQQSHSGDSLAEWRSSEQVENGTPSTSPAYSDTDDDDCGLVSVGALTVISIVLYILIYPQDVMFAITSLSFFVLRTMTNYFQVEGWMRCVWHTSLRGYHDLQYDFAFIQDGVTLHSFTIAVINRDPKKSKYSGEFDELLSGLASASK
ncbi:hypothetical protein HU200_005849 [Digitaria exilis]|uniref:Uncharacterized protein n=1 Tax=Digitaria exilis TaxID=1010633 RepID=A0A835KSB8_9POAL|nr:hypothetical protein HU200_005849 [Digitaria exilis]